MILPYLAKWFVSAKFLGKHRPLQTVLFISDECNLRCKHCYVYSREKPVVKSYEQIRDDLQYSYNLGSRFVDFEGGEPMIWHDGEKNINDLIALAKEIGFFSTTITTNAQLPLNECKAHSIWVSMDGVGEYHEMIRGKGTWAKLEKNIAESHHPALSVNMTINTLNYTNVEAAIEYAKRNPAVLSISLNFHTPPAGSEFVEGDTKRTIPEDGLFLDMERRNDVIDKIIAMKKAKYPIMNSVSGLKLMKTLDFKKCCWVCNYILPDGTRLPECVGSRAGMCAKCGFCMAGEMRSVMNFKLDTLMAGMRLRVD